MIRRYDIDRYDSSFFEKNLWTACKFKNDINESAESLFDDLYRVIFDVFCRLMSLGCVASIGLCE